MKRLTEQEIRALLDALPMLPASEAETLLAELENLEEVSRREAARADFLAFCHYVYDGFKEGPHHRHMSKILHDVLAGKEARVTVSMPPRFGKSETIAYLFVAWYLGHFPKHHIMMVTHTADLSADFGRKVRNLLDHPLYQQLFPDTVVAKDKAASNNWATTLGGKYLAIGIGASVAGHGAHLLVADDVVSEQAVLAGNPDNAFANAWEYMQVGPIQRLMPGGKIVMIGCMTAETRVLMADGAEKEIQHIKVGDAVATYDAGKISVSRVTNWIKHHDDFVYKIKTTSGKIVRANERHPFLVDREGVRAWIRVRDLRTGDQMIVVVPPPAVTDRTRQKDCANSVTAENCELMDGLDREKKDTGVNGAERRVQPKGVDNLLYRKACAIAATVKHLGVLVSTVLQLSRSAKAILSTGTAFLRKFTTPRLQTSAGCVQSANNLQQERTQELDRSQNCTSITATTQIVCAASCVTTATSQSEKVGRQKCSKPLPDTYGITPDAIVEIVSDGFEPVFDMEIERTENFIANGVVSHNTRWGKKDPIGRALQWAQDNPDSPPWNEIRFPAIINGKSLWVEQWPLEQLLAKKASMQPQFWAAQYMQEPTSEEGALIKREWWQIWEKEDPPPVEFVIQSWDTAHETKNSSDYSACTTWGVWTTEDQETRIILLDAIKGRWEFPDLKKKVLEHYKQWQPDSLIVEKKAAGAPLIQELRRMNIVVQEVSPSRGTRLVSNDKRARVNAISAIFSSGMVYAPDKRWSWEVINETAEFPNGEHDDFVDTVSQAMARYRDGGFVKLPDDYEEPDNMYRTVRKAYY